MLFNANVVAPCVIVDIFIVNCSAVDSSTSAEKYKIVLLKAWLETNKENGPLYNS